VDSSALSHTFDSILLSQVYTGGLDGTIRLWDLDTGEQIEEYEVGLPVFSLVIALTL
jgi:WD40 repeat protein